MLQTTAFQNWIVKRVTSKLSKDLHAKVSIKNIEIGFFNKMLLEGTLILDKKNDTLLYAGVAKVNINDWFFLKDNTTLNYIGLDDAIINLHRKDSVWNYQFLVDYFSNPRKKTDTSKNVIQLDLKIVEFNRVKIWQHDEWKGQNLLVSLNKMNFSTEIFDMKKKVIKINDLNLDHPLFSQYDYEALAPLEKSFLPAKEKNDSRWNEENWAISVKHISIKDGNFVLQKKTNLSNDANVFNGSNINVSYLNGDFKNAQLSSDTLSADVLLSLKERSGFEIKKLATLLKFTPQKMEFNNLDLITNESHLRDYYVMRYKNFNADMANFLTAVELQSNFKQSTVSSNDIAFFAPALKKWNRLFSINGNVGGVIDNLSGNNVQLASGSNYFNGDILLSGLVGTNNLYFDINARDLKSSYKDISVFIPQIKNISQPNLSALGNIFFRGAFKGFLQDFVTAGTLNTNLGSVTTNLNMKLAGNVASTYSGKIKTNKFSLGRFMGDSNIGNVSFAGSVAGKGFDLKNMSISLDGTINDIEYNNYNYRNIIAKGNLKNRFFTGAVSINDPNIKIEGLEGNINFNSKQPQFNFDANVSKINLKNLHLTNDDFSLTGKFNLNFTGDNIDNFLGYARIYNATLFNKGQQLSFNSLSINSDILDNKKYLSLQSNEVDANISGAFKILELPEAFQLLLNRYYPAYINPPKRIIHDQNFSFNIKTKQLGDYISLLNKKITGFDNATLSGNLDLLNNTLNLNADVPSFSYSNINFSNLNFKGAGTFDTLSLTGNVADIIINDSLHLPDTRITVSAANDVSDISIKTSASTTVSEADLSLQLQTLRDGFKLNFNPSSFVINDKKWVLEKGGQLVLNKKLLTASEVKFVHNDQQIILSTQPSDITNSNDVVVQLKKINIADVAPFVLKSPKLEGLITGELKINDPFGNLSVEYDTKIDQFYFENDSIGLLIGKGSYSSISGDVISNIISDNALYNFTAGIAYQTKDSSSNQLRGSLNLNRSNIHFLEKYLGDILSGISGNATGQLNISGRAKDAKITGSVALNDASLTVNYTRCHYIIQNNSVLNFKKDEIDLGNIKIRDTLNNAATISGKLYHSFFNNFFFSDLHFKTDRKNGNPGKFILLNTTSKDNQQFYGYAIGDAELSLDGPETDMRMNITAEPTDSSHIFLPTGETAETGKVNYIEFIKFGREMQADIAARRETNIKVNMAITANPFAKIDVILDETTGDVIKAQGSGKLNISAGTKEPLTIRGRYDVQEGQYTFNFQTFLKTPFSLQSGFIEWQGDPYLANLNIDAAYRATNVDLSNIPITSGYTKNKGNVDIIFKLRGTLKEPRPDFEFLFPFDNPLKSDPVANEYLKRFQSDRNELNRKVTALLLFNTFITEQQGIFTANNTGNFVFKTVGQVLSATLSSSLNNWLQKLLKTDAVNLYTNINTADFNLEKGITQRQIQNLGNFGFKTAFLKNRLLINFGGNVDYKLVQASSNSNSNFLFTPDVSFEYLVSPGGALRVVGFNRSYADLGDIAGVTRRNRTGVLLSYRKDFDTFYELLFGRKR